MPVSPTDLTWRAAPLDLADLVVGFAERRDGPQIANAIELPLALPLVQFFLNGAYRMGDKPSPHTGLWGPSSRVRSARADGRLHVFVVILTLRGSAALAQSSVHSLAESVQPLALAPAWRDLPERLVASDGFTARIRLAEKWLRNQLAAKKSPAILSIADAIASHRVRGTVRELSKRMGLSPRALQKQFAREIGWTPKLLLRVARLQRVLRTLRPMSWSPSTGDAYLEFADEAHLAHDFRLLTGLSPSGFAHAKRTSGDKLLHTVLLGRPADAT